MATEVCCSLQPRLHIPLSERSFKYEPIEFILTYDTEELGAQMNPTCDIIDTTPTLEQPLYWFHPPNSFSPFQWKGVSHFGRSLVNIANLCFLNATVQCLAYCPPFAQDCLKSQHRLKCQRFKKGDICGYCLFETHVQQMLSSDMALTKTSLAWPNTLLTLLRKDIKMNNGRWFGSHNCAHEWLLEFLNFLVKYDLPSDQTVNFTKGSIRQAELSTSYVHQLFTFLMQEKKVCQTCHKASSKFEVIPCLHVFIHAGETSVNLGSALARAFEVEHLHGANRPMCDFCGVLRDKAASRHIYDPPNVLIILIQRLEIRSINDRDHHKLSYVGKNSSSMNIPLQLDLTQYLSPEYLTVHPNNHQYNFIGSINHAGSAGFGHYWAVVKGPDGFYHKVDDDYHTVISQSKLDKYTSSAYLVFYIRQHPKPQRTKELSPVTLYSDWCETSQRQRENPTTLDVAKNQSAFEGQLRCSVEVSLSPIGTNVFSHNSKRLTQKLFKRQMSSKYLKMLVLQHSVRSKLRSREVCKRKPPKGTKQTAQVRMKATKPGHLSNERSTTAVPPVKTGPLSVPHPYVQLISKQPLGETSTIGQLQSGHPDVPPLEESNMTDSDQTKYTYTDEKVGRCLCEATPVNTGERVRRKKLNPRSRLDQLKRLDSQYGCSLFLPVEAWYPDSDVRETEEFHAVQRSLMPESESRSDHDKQYDAGRRRKHKRKTREPTRFKEFAEHSPKNVHQSARVSRRLGSNRRGGRGGKRQL